MTECDDKALQSPLHLWKHIWHSAEHMLHTFVPQIDSTNKFRSHASGLRLCRWRPVRSIVQLLWGSSTDGAVMLLPTVQNSLCRGFLCLESRMSGLSYKYTVIVIRTALIWIGHDVSCFLKYCQDNCPSLCPISRLLNWISHYTDAGRGETACVILEKATGLRHLAGAILIWKQEH